MIVYTFFKTGFPQEGERPPPGMRYRVVANRPEAKGEKTYNIQRGPVSGGTHLEVCGQMAERVVSDHLDFTDFPNSRPLDYEGLRVSFEPPYDRKLIRRPWREEEVRRRQTFRFNDLERKTVMETSAQELARRADELEEEFNKEVEEADGLGIFDEDVVAEGVDS